MPLKKSFKPGLYLRIVTCFAIFTALFSFLCLANPGAAGAGSRPVQVILSWTDDPATTQTIAWRAAGDAVQGQVQYLPAKDFRGSFYGAQSVTAVETGLYNGYSHFEATLRGLSPGTGYIYRVGRECSWSVPSFFTTAGPERKFSFLYMGDVQQGYDAWGKMLQSAFKDNPGLKFGLLGGDLVYDGASSEEWQQFFAAATPVFRCIPLMPAVGNHDDKPLFWDSFALPRNGPAGLEEKFYSFDYGNCHIAVLNSNLMGVSNPFYSEIYNWLRQDLTNSDRQWKFLVLHYPPYPVVFDGHAGNLQENWAPLFEECSVDVAFVGHQHVYMRTKPLRGGQVQANPQDGIVYIMGNAGTKYYPAGTGEEYMCYIDKQVAGVSNYQVINIDGGVFTLTARDAAGQVIDSYTLRKQPVALADTTVTALLAPVTIVDAGGQVIMTDPPPVIIENRTMVPIFMLAGTLQANVAWDADQRTVTVTRGRDVMRVRVDSDQARISGRSLSLEVPACIVSDRVYVPLKLVAEALGAEVDWNNVTRTVKLTPGSEAVKP